MLMKTNIRQSSIRATQQRYHRLHSRHLNLIQRITEGLKRILDVAMKIKEIRDTWKYYNVA